MNRRIAAAWIVSAIVAIAPLYAGSVSAPMRVSLQVIARAIVTVDAQPTVIVTPADLAHGDVNLHTTLRALTNSRAGYMLQVSKTSGDFGPVSVDLPGATMRVDSDASWIERPYVAGGESVPVTARLYLAPGATAGPHALPISFSASPL